MEDNYAKVPAELEALLEEEESRYRSQAYEKPLRGPMPKFAPADIIALVDQYIAKEGFHEKTIKVIKPNKEVPDGRITERAFMLITWQGFQDFLGISRRTIGRYRDFSPEYADAIEIAENRIHKHVQRGVGKGDIEPRMGLAYVKGKHKEDYAVENNLIGGFGGNITINFDIPPSLTFEEQEVIEDVDRELADYEVIDNE